MAEHSRQRGISPKDNKSTESAALNYAFELTNFSNHNKFIENDNNAKSKEWTKEGMKEFVDARFKLEAESVINTIATFNDLAKANPDNQALYETDFYKNYVSEFKDDFEKYSKGELKKEDLINKIAEHGEKNATEIVTKYQADYFDLVQKGKKERN